MLGLGEGVASWNTATGAGTSLTRWGKGQGTLSAHPDQEKGAINPYSSNFCGEKQKVQKSSLHVQTSPTY